MNEIKLLRCPFCGKGLSKPAVKSPRELWDAGLPEAVKEIRERLWEVPPCPLYEHKIRFVEGCTICLKCGWML